MTRKYKKDRGTNLYLAPGQTFSNKQRELVKLAYLEAFRELGIITPAAQRAGVSNQTIGNWRRMDPDFDTVCTAIWEEWNDKIRLEIYNRAVVGVPEDVVSNGRVVTITRRSDILLMFLAKSRMPEFRENGAIADSGSAHLEGIEDRIEGRITEMAKRLREAARVETSGLASESAHSRVGPNPLVDMDSLRDNQPSHYSTRDAVVVEGEYEVIPSSGPGSTGSGPPTPPGQLLKEDLLTDDD